MPELREYQKEDVIKIVQQRCVGNFSEQRTGKTPTTCVALSILNLPKILIVCPASLQYVWKLALKEWADKDATIITTTKITVRDLPTTGTLIVNYEKLRGTSAASPVADALLKWCPDAMVLDESHRMKERKSLTAKQIHRFIKTPVKLALTGTPATNKPWDVWTTLNWLFPETYKSYWKFIDEYFEEETIWVAGVPYKQPSHFKKGMEKILQMNLAIKCIQHKRNEVMRWLPDVTEPTKILLPATNEQQAAINDLMLYFEHKNIVTQTVLDNLIRVRQVCAAPEILGLKGKSPKIDWLKQYLKDYPDKQVLVFSNSKKFLLLISRELEKVSHSIICGDVPPKNRAERVKMFQDGRMKVMLCQTQACKEGLTLDAADTSIFLDVYPPSADYLQAKDRMVATTPERSKPKELYHVMMQGTYDEKTFALVQRNINETALINDYKKYVEERKKHNG